MNVSMRVLVCVVLLASGPAFGQGTNATLSGSVADQAGALMAGASLTLENTQTGVKFTTQSNEAGVYQFPGVQPGIYRLTAQRRDFQTVVYPNLVLEVSAQVNLALKIAGVQQTVEVTADLDSPLAAATASVGTVINGGRVSDFPVADRNVLRFVETQGGVVESNIAGARMLAVNVIRDAIPVSNEIGNDGVSSVVYLSADLVGEIRVVTSPADAELGRGSGQVQITTRSGGNEYHGSLFESHRNTALNANTFFNNQRGDPRDFLIRNQFGGRIGGPIVKNKTFFHFLYDAQREVSKATTTSVVYTAAARQGLFRFYPGVLNANFNAQVPTVDIAGNPVKPATATGDLQSISVFGRDPVRPVMDPTGTVQRLMDMIPLPNNFREGDGLNTAGYSWSRRVTSDRDQFNVRIDHHINDRHQFNLNWTHQTTSSLNGYSAQVFPQTPGGSLDNTGKFLSFRAASILSSRIVNDFHAGTQSSRDRSYAPWELEGQNLLPVASGVAYRPNFLAASGVASVFPGGPPFGGVPAGAISRLNVFGDDISWVSGRHTFKFGGEVRFGSSDDAFVDTLVTPIAAFGAGGPQVTGLGIAGIGGNQAAAQNLLINLSGSLANVMQRFYTTGGANPVYEAIKDGQHAGGDIYQREFSAFFKDDWKMRRDLTLNLGIRYEYYSVPWMSANNQGGGTPAVVGGSSGLYGLSGTSFADLYQPGRLNGTLTRIEFVGPKSPNPNKQIHNDDWNNFAPAVGLSWHIPYFGAGKTVLRMGYGIGYEKLPLFVVGNTVGATPGLVAATTLASAQYLDLSRLSLPLSPVGTPLDPVPLTDRNQPIGIYDTNLRTGYVQNWNLSVQRELPGRMSLDVRYLGSKGTKLVRQIDINEANIFESGILEAFLITQAGGNAPLLDRIFNGLNQPGLGVVNGATVTGSQFVRLNTNTRGFFANNHVGGFAEYLNNTPNFTNVRGGLLRRANLPENLIVGNPQFSTARIAGNHANSTYHAMQLEVNKRFSSGWTLQSNYTWSRTLGEHAGSSNTLIETYYRDGRNRHLDKQLLPFHRTHAFKTNGTVELPFGSNRRFLNGGGLLTRLTERWQFGAILNLVSGQPITLVSQTESFNQYPSPGALTLNNTVKLVGALPRSFGNVAYDSVGVLYFQGLQIAQDPAVAALTTAQDLRLGSGMQAIIDAGGSPIAVNPAPGTTGSLAHGYLEGPGQVRFDLNLIKRIRIGEGKEFEFRADAIDVLNRPNFANPITDINSPKFGRIEATNSGNRIIVLNARFNF